MTALVMVTVVAAIGLLAFGMQRSRSGADRRSADWTAVNGRGHQPGYLGGGAAVGGGFGVGGVDGGGCSDGGGGGGDGGGGC